jgi:4-amino-4-deoxy-L-arabinose transferase-like glycosyltransferase
VLLAAPVWYATSMLSRKLDRADATYAGGVTLLHIIAATLYARVAGISIVADPQRNTWDWFWQLLPLDALRRDLWRSLWYLHAQPPLYNLYGGLVAKIFFPHHLQVIYGVNVVLGGLVCGMVYLMAAHLLRRRWAAIVWAMVLCLNPPLFLYEAYVLYTLPTAFLVMLTVGCLLWYRQTGRSAALYGFMTAVCLLVLTRSLYHPIIIAVALGLIWLAAPRPKRLRTALICAAIGLVPLGWCLKNSVMFGFFGTSSWQGTGLWRTVAAGYTKEELDERAAVGVIDSMVVNEPVFARPSAYQRYGFTKRSSVGVLSRDDYNNVNFPDIGARYSRNAVRLIRKSPRRYARAVREAYGTFCRPSSRYTHMWPNASKMEYHERFYSEVLQGTVLLTSGSRHYGGVLFFLLPAALVLYPVLFCLGRAGARAALADAVRDDVVMVWCFAIILYTTVVGCLFEIGENMRFKFLVEQPMWLFIGVVATRILLWSGPQRTPQESPKASGPRAQRDR